MSLILAPRPLQILNVKPLAMLTFLTERARLNNMKYAVGGAVALQLHGIIDRKTEDVDFYIPSGMTRNFHEMLYPHLNESRKERAVFPRLAGRWTNSSQALERATKMTVFYHYDLEEEENAKADISESAHLLDGDGDDKFVVKLEDGLQVVSVPVLTVFKLCAMCRGSRNGRGDNLLKDTKDLASCLKYLRMKNPQSISPEIQELLQRSEEEFSWESLRDVLGRVPDEIVDDIKTDLGYLGFPVK